MKYLLLITGAMGLVSSLAMAKGSSNLMRGGYGFLFPDANSFINGGQMAKTSGTAIEGLYQRNDQLDTQTATPSVVWGSGRVGLGAFATRTGSALTGDPASRADSVGAGLGVSLAQGKVTVGGTVERSIDTGQSNDGVVTAALNYNGSKGKGFHLGGGFSSTLNSLSGTETKTATLATGWVFEGSASFEINYKLKDLDQTSNNYVASSYLNFGGSNYYFSTGYSYDRPTRQNTLETRVGFIMGSYDFSFHGKKIMKEGNDPDYGATLRTTF